MKLRKLVFLTAVYNRKDKTLHCLQQITEVLNKKNIDYDVLIVDDSSTDGTKQSIEEHYPKFKVITTPGNYYWAGAMRYGVSQIPKIFGEDFDHLIAFNDDSNFYEDALEEFIEKLPQKEILVGAFECKNGNLSYGGRLQRGFWPLNFEMPMRKSLGKLVDVANFNLVGIPLYILNHVSLIDDYFTHNSADFDFSLRARNAGYQIRMFDKIVGIVERNPTTNTSADLSLSRIARMQRLCSVKEYPVRQRFLFCKAHGGASWFLWFIRPYVGFCFKLLRSR